MELVTELNRQWGDAVMVFSPGDHRTAKNTRGKRGAKIKLAREIVGGLVGGDYY